MDIVILIVCGLLGVLGLIFSILPPLPGPLFPLGALFIMHYGHPQHYFSGKLLIIMTVITVIVMIIENLIPIYGTKKLGGSKAGIIGSTVGLFAGLFLLTPVIGPFSIIAGPFAGAMIGELITGKPMDIAFKSGFGSFLGFLAGTGLKLMLVAVMMWQMGAAIF
jgi:uncharacterized protein YqgC (DUF456 family)